jgi:hypothetical protein
LVAVQGAELPRDQILACLDHLLRRFAFVGGVAIGHEDRPEGGVQVRREEGRPAMRLGLGADAVTPG